MPKYKVEMTWTMYKSVEVEAKSKKEAIEDPLVADDDLADGQYLEDSFQAEAFKINEER